MVVFSYIRSVVYINGFIMKKIYNLFVLWQCNRRFRKLYRHFVFKEGNNASDAADNALIAFRWLYGNDYEELVTSLVVRDKRQE